MLIIGQGTKDSFLVMFQIPEQILTFDTPKTKRPLIIQHATLLCNLVLLLFLLVLPEYIF